MIQAITLLAGLENYLNTLQANSDTHYQKNLINLWNAGLAPKFEWSRGPKWIKVTTIDNQTSVFCFIDPTTGDIYKAATWSKPAKHIRGNIFDEKPPLTLSSLYNIK